MNDTIMAGEIEAPKKVAFANRKYSNEEKRKLEEDSKKNSWQIFKNKLKRQQNTN